MYESTQFVLHNSLAYGTFLAELVIVLNGEFPAICVPLCDGFTEDVGGEFHSVIYCLSYFPDESCVILGVHVLLWYGNL